MNSLTEWLDAMLYPAFRSNWDDELFRSEVLSVLRPGFWLLDVGAGAGIVPQMNFRGFVARVCGVDFDERVTRNPFLDEGKVAGGEKLPYADATFDVAIADNVLEHLADPVAVFAEVSRVLKPGGVFLVKTPNKWHYMPFVARMTPHWFHRAYNKLRGREAQDTFPTLYRVNTRSDLVTAAGRAGFAVESVKLVEGRPEYLRPFALGYLAGWAYERAVNASERFSSLRIVLMATLRKGQASQS